MKTKSNKKAKHKDSDGRSDYSKSENTSAVSSSSSDDDDYKPLLTSKDKYDFGINIHR